MAAKGQAGWQPSISDEAVKANTGRGWMGWFVILNKANAGAMTHSEIARLLHKKGAGDWWSQMIAVEFERSRGDRQKHQRQDGFSVSASKTIVSPLAKLYKAIADGKQRAKWFPEGAFKLSSQTKNKYCRGSWNGDARLEFGFYAKGAGKSQIAVQISKLANKSGVERERTAWKKALEKLAGYVQPKN